MPGIINFIPDIYWSMAKGKKPDNATPRGKYAQKIKVDGTFLDVIKVIVKEPENKYQGDESSEKWLI